MSTLFSPAEAERLRARLGAEEESLAARAERPLRVAVLEAGAPLRVRVLSGRLQAGEELVFSPRHQQARVMEIATAGGELRDRAEPGEEVRLTLRPALTAERGQIAFHPQAAPLESNRGHALLQWEGPGPASAGERLWLTLAGQRVEAELLEPAALAPGVVAEVALRFRGALVMDNAEHNPALARFTLTGAGGQGRGLIFGGLYTGRTEVKSTNITWTEGDLTPPQRALRNGHKGAVLWLTGLSGSGKSTLSRALERRLFALGMHVYVLDGDNVRRGLNANLGFSPEDREENIRRVAEVAKLLSHAGFIAITAFISPYRRDRGRAREIALEAGGEFIEVFVDAPLAVCEQRDVKGLYKKARAGEIRDFTGISAPYEAPLEPEVTVPTDRQTLAESASRVIEYLTRRLRAEAEDFVI